MREKKMPNETRSFVLTHVLCVRIFLFFSYSYRGVYCVYSVHCLTHTPVHMQ